VYLTLVILANKLGFIYTVGWFWLDGFAVPVPAQVTQTVRRTSSCAIVTIANDIFIRSE
jgi:hypothetical protein